MNYFVLLQKIQNDNICGKLEINSSNYIFVLNTYSGIHFFNTNREIPFAVI